MSQVCDKLLDWLVVVSIAIVTLVVPSLIDGVL